MNALRPVLIVAMLVGFARFGSADDSWAGQKVMQTKPKVKFAVNDDDGQRDFELKGVCFTVLKEKDGLLRLRGDDGKEGWAEMADFTLLADAPGVYTDMIKADEKNGWAWHMRGAAWDEKGEFDKAVEDYSEVIRLDSKFAGAFNDRGLARLNLKEYDKAFKDFDEAIRLDPKKVVAFNNRGNMRLNLKEYDEAIKDYDEAIRLDPNYASALSNRGLARAALKGYDKAIKDYDEAIRINPKFGMAFNNRGNARRDLKEYDKAIKDFDEAIRLDPKYALAFLNRGTSLLSSRRPKAPADFQTAIDVQGWKGDLATYATILGQLSARIDGDEVSAKKFLSNAESKLDEKAWPYPAVQYLRGDLDGAALLKLATDDAKRTEARCFLGFDLLLRGKKDQALAHFKWVKDKGTQTYIEYGLALAELERLEKAKDK